MINKETPLTKAQKEIITEFYSHKPVKVIFNKEERDNLWKQLTDKTQNFDFNELNEKCPALSHQIKKSYENQNYIQSAVFSECVYAQALAKLFKLELFINCDINNSFLSGEIIQLLHSYNLVPRYVYSSIDKSRMLIQAGGSRGIDSALITIINPVIFKIEFKEPSAKTSEPDLPKYGEDGILKIKDEFLEKNPQFDLMLKEQVGLNFFNSMGSNINNFSFESIDFAVSNNYCKSNNFYKKDADVIVTEDIDGSLTMIPANQVSRWAEIQGEIRPAGRNHYCVWTPNALRNFLNKIGAKVDDHQAIVNKDVLDFRIARGSDGKISGYKINPLFFVFLDNCKDLGSSVKFDINSVRQLNPTIAGKIFFKELKYSSVKKYYMKLK
ncbi:hypothetical protein JN00_0160 [Metamycoplasma subdolum]|uniref:Uncharacterized protein n=2 Tax=Metamycoplasma subdolum TaxID=92407 RepID=A0A3M0A6H6_9BACT|nr:hypothetical protein JN00_0160 [Metamycoplasma subdolum]